MATVNPSGRANYEPNSWPADEGGGPREDPVGGYSTFTDHVDGEKRRLRPESFADHFSQARQFYVSQTDVERRHIQDAFVFELGKCDVAAIRLRMLANLRNVDAELAHAVAAGLGVAELPDASVPAQQPRADLAASPALSIIENGPDSFTGRKLGVLLTDGADAGLFAQVQEAAAKRRVTVEVVAPVVGGASLSDGSKVTADQSIDGGPSVLYDAVVLLMHDDAATQLSEHPEARDFVTDAFAHCKFIGYCPQARLLFDATGLTGKLDDGFIRLDGTDTAEEFLDACTQLRYWAREATFG